MKFAGDTATAIRMYSQYSRGTPMNGGQRRDPAMAPVDLMFLSDALTQLLNIGGAIERRDPTQIVDTCHSVQKLFESYATDNPSFSPQAKPTFDYWEGLVDLGVAVKALKMIQDKVKMPVFAQSDSRDLVASPLASDVVLGNCTTALPMKFEFDPKDNGHMVISGPPRYGMSAIPEALLDQYAKAGGTVQVIDKGPTSGLLR